MRGSLEESKKSNVRITVEQEILDELKTESKTTGHSLNNTINRVLTKYYLFYRHVNYQDAIVATPRFMPLYLRYNSEKAFQDALDKFSLNTLPTIFIQNDIPLTLETMIDHCFNGLALWGGLYDTFTYSEDKLGNLNLTFKHHFGLKWSNIMGKSFCRFIETKFHRNTKLRTSSHTVRIAVESN